LIEGGDKAWRFDGGDDGGEDCSDTTLDGKLEDMSKVTLMPLLSVVVVEDTGFPPSLETKWIGGAAMGDNNEWP